jgi:site-specific recombinase XerD
MHGVPWLMASVLYGSGLRLMECCQLRVKDVDLDRLEIRVRRGKGARDRVTMLPKSMVEQRVGCHTFRHSVATHLLEAGYDIRTVGTPGREHDDAVHPRAESGWAWGSEPA